MSLTQCSFSVRLGERGPDLRRGDGDIFLAHEIWEKIGFKLKLKKILRTVILSKLFYNV